MRKWLSVRTALARWDSFMGDLGCVLMIDEECGCERGLVRAIRRTAASDSCGGRRAVSEFVCQTQRLASEGLPRRAIPANQFVPLPGCELRVDESPEHVELAVTRDRRNVIR